MRCKIVRTHKLMWRNSMKSTKSQKASVLHYSIDIKCLRGMLIKKKKAKMQRNPLGF